MMYATLSVSDGKIKIAHPDLNEELFADPQELKRCLEELDQLPGSALASELQNLAGLPGASPADCLADLTRRLSAREEISLSQASQLFSEPEARGKFIPAAEFFRAQVERELEDAVKSGKILPRQRDDWRKVALSDFLTFRKLLAEQKPQVPLRPLGFAAVPPDDAPTQVKLLVEQRVRERQISFGQALTELGRERPDLVQQYRRSVGSE